MENTILSRAPSRDFTASPPSSRRGFLGLSLGGVATLALAGCASYQGYSFTEAIRRLLTIASQDAFEQLLAPGGFYDDQLARLSVDEVLGNRGGVLARILGSTIVRERMMREFNRIAAEGAYRAAPVVADTIRIVGFENAVALVSGEPTAATGYLRTNMGSRLIDVMLPEVSDALRVIDDPVLGPALSELSGVNLSGVADSLTRRTEDAIWSAIGREEAAIRADPYATNDPVLIGVFGARNAVR
ncbi:DUF4197 domain-containing protein [Croceicoccus mobilis]|uniref:DUF4197 domain-containing protein n=1 Tax=Croceicoccus mobilis TaxID=1703339 RepID=A0A916YZ21_9SPHN|nr:DUF4197 domain-containing protein [Croceicoccus mobilis]GGD67811.1 hypothetical protein GCM10010990_16640 [Croceicoccus mobilis]